MKKDKKTNLPSEVNMLNVEVTGSPVIVSNFDVLKADVLNEIKNYRQVTIKSTDDIIISRATVKKLVGIEENLESALNRVTEKLSSYTKFKEGVEDLKEHVRQIRLRVSNEIKNSIEEFKQASIEKAKKNLEKTINKFLEDKQLDFLTYSDLEGIQENYANVLKNRQIETTNIKALFQAHTNSIMQEVEQWFVRYQETKAFVDEKAKALGLSSYAIPEYKTLPLRTTTQIAEYLTDFKDSLAEAVKKKEEKDKEEKAKEEKDKKESGIGSSKVTYKPTVMVKFLYEMEYERKSYLVEEISSLFKKHKELKKESVTIKFLDSPEN